MRLGRWAGDRTIADRLVLGLHVAYAFVPAGFLLLGASMLWPADVPASAGIHAWTAGAVGLMTLAVMTRASLGHAGRPLVGLCCHTGDLSLRSSLAALARIAAALGGMTDLRARRGPRLDRRPSAEFVAVYGPLLIARPPVWAAKP